MRHGDLWRKCFGKEGNTGAKVLRQEWAWSFKGWHGVHRILSRRIDGVVKEVRSGTNRGQRAGLSNVVLNMQPVWSLLVLPS